MTSTRMSASEERMSAISSVQRTVAGSQSTRLRSTLRLQIWVSRRPAGDRSDKIRATELPTVPNPTIATFSDFGALGGPCSVSAVAELGPTLAIRLDLDLWSDG